MNKTLLENSCWKSYVYTVYLKNNFLALTSEPSHRSFTNRDKKISIPAKSVFKVAMMASDKIVAGSVLFHRNQLS